jgi:hypothetical protein
MIFDKMKVGVHAFQGRCLVHLIYGNERDGSTEDGILSSLRKAGIKTEPFYRNRPNKDDIAACLGHFGSMSFCLDGVDYQNAQGGQSDGNSISFYTTTKDAAKAAITQLKKDGFKFNKSTPLLHIEINNTYDKAQTRGVA